MLDRRFRRCALAFAAVLLFAAGPVGAQTVPTSREQIGLTFAPLVKKVAPAVANIYARQVIQAREVSPLFNDPFFQQFFGQGAFGVGQTVTSGIVSGVARTRVGISDYGFFIQTDAAINPGNSGGALVAMDGKLVGINTAIFSQSGGSVGIGFAIPSDMVAALIAAEQHGGKLVTPWIGAGGQAVTSDLGEGLKLDRPRGVIIGNIYKAGSAEKAGLQVGDVVVAINGHEVADPQSLRFRLAT